MKNLIYILSLIIILTIYGQVGINTDTPQQALDINGKVQIGDDGIEASEGTLRYNAQANDFEGFNGSKWSSLTQSAASDQIIPAEAVPIVGYVPTIWEMSENWDFKFETLQKGLLTIGTDSPNEGKLYVISSIAVTSLNQTSSTDSDPVMDFEISPIEVGSTRSDDYRKLRFITQCSSTCTYTYTSNDPIWILSSNDILRITLRDDYRFIVRGWMIDAN